MLSGVQTIRLKVAFASLRNASKNPSANLLLRNKARFQRLHITQQYMFQKITCFNSPCYIWGKKSHHSFWTRQPCSYLLTTPWYTTLFEKPSLSLSKNIPPSYGTRRFITVFTKARHRTLSWASRIQFASSIPISLRSILMLSSYPRLGLPSGLLPSGFPTKAL
jgi:hypothetical protein